MTTATIASQLCMVDSKPDLSVMDGRHAEGNRFIDDSSVTFV
jgi:hypothetical protein